MREWKPGDVALVAGDVAIRVAYSGGKEDRAFVDGLGRHWRNEDGTARPLVVIDPEDREQVERLTKAMHESDHIAPWHDLHNETRAQIEAAMQSALREFANPTPPKPDEPMGLGAVVEDARGRYWLRDYERGMRPWRPIQESPANGRHAPNTLAADREGYAEIAAVRVLSEGVQP